MRTIPGAMALSSRTACGCRRSRSQWPRGSPSTQAGSCSRPPASTRASSSPTPRISSRSSLPCSSPPGRRPASRRGCEASGCWSPSRVRPGSAGSCSGASPSSGTTSVPFPWWTDACYFGFYGADLRRAGLVLPAVAAPDRRPGAPRRAAGRLHARAALVVARAPGSARSASTGPRWRDSATRCSTSSCSARLRRRRSSRRGAARSRGGSSRRASRPAGSPTASTRTSSSPTATSRAGSSISAGSSRPA